MAHELGDRTFTTPPDIAEFPVANITKPWWHCLT